MEVELQMSAKHIVNCVKAAPLKSTPISPLNRKPLSEYEFTYLISLSLDFVNELPSSLPPSPQKNTKKKTQPLQAGFETAPPKELKSAKEFGGFTRTTP
jgi:hypothetical protein